MTINQQVTFDTDKLNLFLNRTNKPHLKAYQEEILQIVNAVGTVCEWGIEVWGIMFPNNNKVNLPKKYLIVLS